MSHLTSPRLVIALLWAALTFVSLALRPLFPIDETRYAAVAWEMWARNDFLVPHLNGETYSHKPPLLFWLMQLSWWLFGVNDWSLRVIAPLFSLATLYLSEAVAKTLWPDRPQIAQLTPFILLGSFFWMVYGTLTMFDIMLSFFALFGIYAIALQIRHGLSIKRWALLGVAIGGGILSKGPVILLHLLPLALLAPWWLTADKMPCRKSQWYLGLLSSVLFGACIALCWAIPAGIAGGEAYQRAIFLGQTTGRVVDSFAHKLPFWWYLQLLPLLLLPWLLLKPFWSGLARFDKTDFGCRFCMFWIIPIFVAFSFISGKRIHYLLPLMPALALCLAWALAQVADSNWRQAQRKLALVFAFIALALIFLHQLNSLFSLHVKLPPFSLWPGILLLLGAFYLEICAAKHGQGLVINVCTVSITAALVCAGGYFQSQGYRYDTSAPAHKIAELMQENRPVAFYGSKYHGQFHFAGRLTQPIQVIPNRKALLDFARSAPTGYVLVEYKEATAIPKSAIRYQYSFKSHYIGFIGVRSLLENTAIVPLLNPA